MKLSGFLTKPRWLSKDAAIRLLAIGHDNDSELVANLGRLAREDPDPRVRAAAMKRVADAGIAQGIAHDDADAGVRAQARALWLDLLTGTHVHAPSLVERLRLLRAQDDNELIEHIARHAREGELRRAALARVTRAGFLLDRALDDAEADIRLGLVDRINDDAQLSRLAERARKSDKQVSRRARERIEALRIARGDGATVEQRARLLCEQIEQLIRQPRHGDPDAEATIGARWREIRSAVPLALCARFDAAQALLAASRAARVPPEPAQAEVADEVPLAADDNASLDGAPGAAEGSEQHIDALIAPLLAQARFAASIDEAAAEQRQQRERERARLDELVQALATLDTAIDAGASASAHAAKASVDELRRSLGAPLPRALAQQLAAVEARYAQISRWQHWADNQRRRQLCDEIETLASAGVHPDAVATRVREAQAEWTRLDAIEGRDAAKPGGLARQFHAACRAALAPTQAYFAKRHELRQSQAQRVAQLLERVAALGADSDDWPAIATLRREIVDALRGLDSVEPRARKTLAQNLKASLTDLDARVARRDEEVERAKGALIVQAQALGQGAPQRGAVAAARELQQRWQRAGNGRRARDQAQWKTFRTAIDAVFAQLDAERNERSAREADERAQGENLCAEMEALAAEEAVPERGAIARLQSAWNALRSRDETLARRFDDAQTRLRDAAGRRERALRHARFTAWLARYRLCRAIERQSLPPHSASEQWSVAAATDIAPAALARRFDAALQGAPLGAGDNDASREILIELEFLAGVEVGDGEREQRRLLQVARLSARLRGDKTATTAEELADLLARWTALDATVDASLDERLERALAAALDTLP